MPSCKHQTLTLLTESVNKVRCNRCHLTISKTELGDGYCPECYEIHHEKHHDFEMLSAEDNDKTRYRCDGCGIFIEMDL